MRRSLLPRRLRHTTRVLRDARQHLVPYIAFRRPNGTPEYGKVEGNRIRQVLKRRLCGFCAVPFLGETGYYLARVGSHGNIVEVPAYRHQAPMHAECLEAASRLCPELVANASSLRIVPADEHADATRRLLDEVETLRREEPV